MSDQKHDRFGRYLILDHLVDGGMAKICRARFLGEQAEKIVAIKMVQQQFSKDPAFKTMFMDEIKVTFGLLHPNIVQTYDYGLHQDQLYVAMEYCDGRNLKEYLDRLRQKKFVFPVEISIYIISQVCQGLHYSHTYTDKLTGKQANIIHRDISPHNIMLTYDGSVKVIDFGIAKAESNSEATQAGTIKGKLSYLAPEYLDGLDLDHRYDQFAVGITLWEMLCSRKLFKAANDLAVLKKIQECKVPPPSSINPNVPKELDEIVLRALKKDRNKRFEDMDKFNRALIKFLYANYPDFNASDLSYFAKELFKEEIKKDREKLFEFGKIDIKPYLNDLKREQEGGTGSDDPSEDDGGSDSAKQRKQEHVIDFGFEEEDTSTNLRSTRTKTKVGAEKTSLNIGGGDAPPKLDANVGAQPARRRNRSGAAMEEKSNKTQLKKRKGKSGTNTRSSTKVKKLKKKSSGSSPAVIFGLVGMLAGLAFYLKDELPVIKEMIYGAKEPVAVTNPKDPQQPEDGVEEIPTAKAGKAKIYLAGFDKHNQNVYVNGKKKAPDFLGQIEVTPNATIIVRIETPGHKHYVKTLQTRGGEDITLEIPKQPPENFGFLQSDAGCRMGGRVFFELYGEKRVEQLPIRNLNGIAFPVKGDGRTPASADGKAQYTLFYQKRGETIRRKMTLSFDKPGERLNICDAFNKNAN